MRRIAIAGALAVALLGVGTLAAVRGPEPRPAGAPSDGAALLAPGGTGRLEDTIAGLQARLRRSPGDWRAAAFLGLAYLQEARATANPSYYAKAEGLLTRSLDGNRTENFEAALGMGVLALGRHDFAAGLRWGRRAAGLNPYSAQARGVVGDGLLELGRYRAAARAYQDMIDLHPDVASYARVSYYRELHGDVAGAAVAMRGARDAAGAPEDAAWTGYHLGQLYLGAGRLVPASRAFRQAAAMSPDHVLPRAGLARVAAARGDLGRATRLLSGVVARYPAPEFVILLGDLFGAGGDRGAAAEQYALVRAMDRLYRAGGVNTDLEMALFAADHGRGVRRAVARARAEYRRRPSVTAADALGWTLYADGRFRAARRYAGEALRLGTRSALFHFHAGMIAFRLGDRGEARRHLAAALAIDPHFSYVHAGTARRTLEEVSA